MNIADYSYLTGFLDCEEIALFVPVLPESHLGCFFQNNGLLVACSQIFIKENLISKYLDVIL